MNISFIQAINYINTVNSHLLVLCENKEEKIIQYQLFCNTLKELENKMSNSEYITLEEFKEEFINKLVNPLEHKIIKQSPDKNSIGYMKNDYLQLINDNKNKVK